MRQTIILLFALFLVIIIVTFFIRTHSRPSLTEDQVKSALNKYIQTSYMQATGKNEGFDYKVKSIYRPIKTYLSGDTWCLSIDPPQPVNKETDVTIAHFVISFLDPHWTALGFPEGNKRQWVDIGCEN